MNFVAFDRGGTALGVAISIVTNLPLRMIL